jgi:hypothetical protein
MIAIFSRAYCLGLKAQEERASSLVSEPQDVESVEQSDVGINVMGNTEVVNQVVEPTEASVIEAVVEFKPVVVETADVEAELAIIEPVAIAELNVESEFTKPIAIAELELSEPITATTVDVPSENFCRTRTHCDCCIRDS